MPENNAQAAIIDAPPPTKAIEWRKSAVFANTRSVMSATSEGPSPMPISFTGNRYSGAETWPRSSFGVNCCRGIPPNPRVRPK